MGARHPPQQILADFNASDPEFITKTAIARVWKVSCRHGLAALKIYHKPTMGKEANGFIFLNALNGGAAAKVYKTSKRVALMEWLDGPPLGDMTRDGKDAEASVELVAVANRLHQQSTKLNLTPLEDWFSWLFKLKFTATCPPEAQQHIKFCQSLARELLASQTDVRPLHGDLHHDNIRLGARGYTAFDAKGLLGERAFELANAFRNPKGAEDTVSDPRRIRMLLELWSAGFSVDQRRLLQWATVKIALSISWRCKGTLTSDPELPLLATFVEMLRTQRGSSGTI